MSKTLRTLGIAVLVVGLLVLAAGVIYYTVPGNKLPGFMGQIAHSTAHRTKRGLAGVVGGLVLSAAGIFMFIRSKAYGR